MGIARRNLSLRDPTPEGPLFYQVGTLPSLPLPACGRKAPESRPRKPQTERAPRPDLLTDLIGYFPEPGGGIHPHLESLPGNSHRPSRRPRHPSCAGWARIEINHEGSLETNSDPVCVTCKCSQLVPIPAGNPLAQIPKLLLFKRLNGSGARDRT